MQLVVEERFGEQVIARRLMEYVQQKDMRETFQVLEPLCVFRENFHNSFSLGAGRLDGCLGFICEGGMDHPDRMHESRRDIIIHGNNSPFTIQK
jgi:hypothetical protein